MLLAKESEYIKNYNFVNKNIPDRNKEQWFIDNKEHRKEYLKDYNKTYFNKNKLLEEQKEFRKENLNKLHEIANTKNDCVCGGKYTTANKSYHKKSEKHINYINNINNNLNE